MRCPQCSGEIPEGSHFCGICGNHIAEVPPPASNPVSLAPQMRRSAAASSPSLFELPAARGPRMARIFVVMTLNLILAGAGAAMIASYLSARADATERANTGAKNEGAGVVEPAPAPTAAPAPAPETVLSASVGVATDTNAAPKPVSAGVTEKPAKAKKDAGSPAGRGGPGSSGGAGSGSGDLTNKFGLPAADAGVAAELPGQDQFAAEISALAGRHQRRLHGCYQQAAKTESPEQPLEGRVDIKFRIMPDGTAIGGRAIANTTGSSLLASCLVAVVESWSFTPGASKPHNFVWPFRFRASR